MTFSPAGLLLSKSSLLACGLAVVAGLAPIPKLLAAPGDPDAFNPSANTVVDTAIVQPDGKVLFAGYFSALGQVNRSGIARFDSTGALDTDFNPAMTDYNYIHSLAVQEDGKIIIGGNFSKIGETNRYNLARLNADGTLDTSFDASLDGNLFALAVQADGKILIGGTFTMVGQVSINRLARLNPDGSLDSTFNPNPSARVATIALQDDGKILVGGSFQTIAGTTRPYLARLETDGTLDNSFLPTLDDVVNAIAVQGDGSIALGGLFRTVNQVSISFFARLSQAGALSMGGDPALNGPFANICVQTDGGILIGGPFTSISDSTGRYAARLTYDGVPDTSFLTRTDGSVQSLSLQPDGKVLIAGGFVNVLTAERSYIARLENDLATDTLSVVSSTRVKWMREGAAPETPYVFFDVSTDGGATFTRLGQGTRISGGWELTGAALPKTAGILRARARSLNGSSSGLVETTVNFDLSVPTLATKLKPKITTSARKVVLSGTSKNATKVEAKIGKAGFKATQGTAASWKITVPIKEKSTTVQVQATGPGGTSKVLKFTIKKKTKK